MTTGDFQIGQKVVWLSTPLFGYGASFTFNGVVVAMSATRVQIEVKKNGGRLERHWVKPERLTARFSSLQ